MIWNKIIYTFSSNIFIYKYISASKLFGRGQEQQDNLLFVRYNDKCQRSAHTTVQGDFVDEAGLAKVNAGLSAKQNSETNTGSLSNRDGQESERDHRSRVAA